MHITLRALRNNKQALPPQEGLVLLGNLVYQARVMHYAAAKNKIRFLDKWIH